MYDVIEVRNGGITVGKVISIKDLRIVLEDLINSVEDSLSYIVETGGDIRVSVGRLRALNELLDWVDEMEEL